MTNQNILLIAHRGNIDGRNPEMENHPEYIDKAISLMYDVEIDLWGMHGALYLGHDGPEHQIGTTWLENRAYNLWIHCKNANALEVCLANEMNCFWHGVDSYTLTSKGHVWAYPGVVPVSKKSVFVMPEKHFSTEFLLQFEPYGICSDYPSKYYRVTQTED